MHDAASDECVLACVSVARLILEGQRVAVDAGDEIVGEYVSTIGSARTAGIATKLAQRLFRLRFDDAICHRVEITPTDDPAGSYDEVPNALQDFDNDDQKFIAVAAAEGASPPILAALDGEWWRRRTDFAANGLDVQFSCVADML